MSTISDKQSSFLDADYLCDQLIPKDSFYRKFRDHVWPLIQNRHFDSMYCGNNGRPPISPRLLAMAIILQFHRNLSDREMERACMFDIEIKFALGLRLDERPFDHSSLGDFRERLIKHDRERAIFDRILKHLIKIELITKDEVQRIDATHVIADIALTNTVTMVKKATYEVLKALKKHRSKEHQKAIREIRSEEYTPERINDDGPGRLDLEQRANRLVMVVKEAQAVLKIAGDTKKMPDLEKSVKVLRTILRENIESSDGGDPREIDAKKKPTNRLISPIDIDARVGAKSKFQKFFGYKTSITQEVKNYFVTNVDTMPGNRRDGEPTVDLVKDQQSRFGLRPRKLIGDSAYGDGVWRQELGEHGTKLVAPFKEKNPRTKAVFKKSDFNLDRKNGTLTCPNGVSARPHYYESAKSSLIFHFPMTACKVCPLRTQCTNAKEGRRTVRIFDWQEATYESERYNLTVEFKKDMKLRQPIEGKFSELKRYHGLARARYRGLRKVALQSFFSATAANVKRWINLTSNQIMKPVMA